MTMGRTAFNFSPIISDFDISTDQTSIIIPVFSDDVFYNSKLTNSM